MHHHQLSPIKSSYLLYFPLSLSKWMLETSRHFIPNYFNMNHPRQGHFPTRQHYVTLQKISIKSKSCCNMQNFLSCSKKCLLRIFFYPIEDSVKFDELLLVMSLQILTIYNNPKVSCHSSYLIH